MKLFRVVAVLLVLSVLAISQTVPATPTFICKGSWRVAPANFIYFPFQTVGPVMVAGNYQAQGGSGNDIRVLIGPRDEVLNALNGHGGTVSFDSGQLTSGTIKLQLDTAGDYLIAFSNTFSPVSEKVVSANIRFTPR